MGCEKFGSQSDGVYVTPICDWSHIISHDNSSGGYSSSSFPIVRIYVDNSDGNYFGQNGSISNDYATVTLTVNGESFTGSTVKVGSWADNIAFDVYDNFAYASGYGTLLWIVTHNTALNTIDVTMKDGSSIPLSNVSMSVNRNGGIVVRSQDIQGHDN